MQLGFAKGLELEKRQILGICGRVVKPLCTEADEVLIYGQEDKAVFKKFLPNVERFKGKYRLQKKNDPVTGFEDYWGASFCERGTVVFLVRCSDELFLSLMKESQDPGFLENPNAIASRSGLRYAKSIVSRSEETVAFVLSANQGLEVLFVFAHPARILRCLEVALAHCELTPRYLGLYGVGT